MTLSEFKAWFEGYTENISGSPNKKQWERIQARVAEIDGEPVTERIYIDRYYPTLPCPPTTSPYWPYTTTGTDLRYRGIGSTVFNSTNAMSALGHSDAVADLH